ncbi:amino acid transporter [Rhodococcus rhodnii]|uniref:Amino acid transporter n=1 Tax=Rhodococcus rhodnii TaxID=38312 RepID=A0A6P2CGA6_9NOCA|nr:amino acid transporter [Rhodococcus rhodnii]
MIDWLTAGTSQRGPSHLGPHRVVTKDEHRHPWWKVMCLTGVDYFSTLGYQPGIAALAAGAIAPVATVVLVALTLLGALPVYRRVARESPHGEGSIAMLARLLPRWHGKIFVLVLLGFAATDFMITITLSTADASAHILENPLSPSRFDDSALPLTILLVLALVAVFLIGFTQAIRIALVIVPVYLLLNAVVIVDALVEIATAPDLVVDWSHAMTTSHGNPLLIVVAAVLVFPRLALGLSGFETGVAVMPSIRGAPGDTERDPAGRIRGAQQLLTTAALVMSGFLLTSSLVTTILIPDDALEPGGSANGRALAYLAHERLGAGFGTAYDAATIAILWFAGASALAGLLNLVPRYLPRYGMAPEWARAVRPLVLIFGAIAIALTVYFDASVDAQGAAYATGVLVLITSATVAVALSARRERRRRLVVAFGAVAVVFVYTTAANVVERPDGVKVASLFVAAIVVVSFLSRAFRSFELRATSIGLDETATRFVTEDAARGRVDLVAHRADGSAADYRRKERVERAHSHIPRSHRLLFLEATVVDASEFGTDLVVTGCEVAGYRVLRVRAAAVPNAIAAVALRIRDVTGVEPDLYFDWSERSPSAELVRFLFLGNGQDAAVTHEVLRRAEPDPHHRPRVHVG